MSDPVVTVAQGQLRGKVAVDFKGGIYYSFQGIPYAKPPLGLLRFKAPQPPESWNGVRDATQEGSECYSRDMVTHSLVGSEDCLFLNVYTPQLPACKSTSLKPVMVWIHGGAFTLGSSKTDFYGPEYLVAEDVVVVTINYRIGLLGFLSIEDPSLDVPGNAGLKDMVLALKWVQTNINNFGGDRDNVTIFGQSAGGASVHLLLLSPMSKGLFHKAIAQSGSGLCPWAIVRRATLELAEALNCKGKDAKILLAELRALSVRKLFEVQESIGDRLQIHKLRLIGPVIEKPCDEPAFLIENPIDIIKAGRQHNLPFIIGYTSREGMLVEMAKKLDPERPLISTDLEEYVPCNLKLEVGSKICKHVANRIKEFYYGNEEPTSDNLDIFYMLNSDNYFVRDICVTAKEHAQSSSAPIYLYRMSVETTFHFVKDMVKIHSPGVCHGEDLAYLFKMAGTRDLHEASIEHITISRITKLWTTFARSGNPNPDNCENLIRVIWKPVEGQKLHYLEIGENLTVGINPEEQRQAFWEEIFNLNPDSFE